MSINTFLQIMNLPLNLSVDEILDTLIIYLRKSRKDMDYYKDESIEKTLQRHEKELQDFIISIFGKPIPEYNIYREVASGDTIEDRPVIQEVLSIIESDEKKAVVCIEIERLARGNTMDQGIIAQTFLYTNTKIITPHKIYNLDNEDDLSYFEEGLYQARKYLMYTKRILKRGRIRSVKDGKYIGSSAPYGYDKMKLPNEKGFTLVFNEKEYKVVQLIADLFLNGLNTTYTVLENDTISSISKIFGVRKQNIISNNLDSKIGTTIKLTINSKSIDYKIKQNDTLETIANTNNINLKDIHIPNDLFKPREDLKIIIEDMRAPNIAYYLNYLQISPRISKTWTANMIRNILQRDAIYGYVTWDRRKETKILNNGKVIKKRLNNSNCLKVKGKHERILTEEEEIQIKNKFKNNSIKYVPNNKELKNPLAGLVICGYCGNNMIRRPYTESKSDIPKLRRVYKIDKEQLRIFLRKNKGDISLNDIAKKLNLTKSSVSNWFANDSKRFNIPPANIWNKLKETLNIKDTKFDKVMTTTELNIILAHPETLICSKPRCKCVGSDLELVEKRILLMLSELKEEYKNYIDNYEEEIIKEEKSNKALIDIIDREIEKIKQQIEKTCEFLETGVYTQDLFLNRSNILNEQMDSLLKQKKEVSKIKDNEKKLYQIKKAIPIIENVLNNYNNNLTIEEKNKLLSSIIKEVIYEKNQGGRYLKENFKLQLHLVCF